MLKDPIHFFDDEGVWALRRQALEAENEKLRAEVERLTRLVASQQRRLLTVAELDATPLFH